MGYVRTLIVDDHADVRFLIRTILADAELPVGIRVVLSKDEFEAIPRTLVDSRAEGNPPARDVRR